MKNYTVPSEGNRLTKFGVLLRISVLILQTDLYLMIKGLCIVGELHVYTDYIGWARMMV